MDIIKTIESTGIDVGDLVANSQGKKAILTDIKISKHKINELYIKTKALNSDGSISKRPGNLYCYYSGLKLITKQYKE